MSLLLDSRRGCRGGALLAAGALASLGANVAAVEPSLAGRVIAAWPSFALTASYELLMRQVRQLAAARYFHPVLGRPQAPAECYPGARQLRDDALSLLILIIHVAGPGVNSS
jgi:hypothetical protein